MNQARVTEDVFFVDRRRGVSLQAQIREIVVCEVLSKRMRPGARLPSTRRLAERLGISRITVSQAYQELVGQGYLSTRSRSAYFVAESPPVTRISGRDAPASNAGVDWDARLPGSLHSYARLEKPRDWHTYPFPFIYGQMDPSLFDHGAWRECTRQALGHRDFCEVAGDATAADDHMLVDYICARSLPRRGIRAGADEVLVTLGAQNALWLAIQLLRRDRFHAVCENPGYFDISNALHWSGARVTPVDVDRDGLPPEALPQDIDAVFVTPSHQSPTAVTMPMDRRQRLLEEAGKRDFIIVEDDYDFEMSFLSAPSPALKSLDEAGRVIYVGSFSKALFPGLRLGYLVASAPFIRAARRLRSLVLRHPPGHLQRTTAYFLALGYYDQLIRRLRTALAERREIAVRAIEREGLELRGAAAFGGTNLWIGGPEGLDSVRLAEALRTDGVLIEPGAPFFSGKPAPIRFFRLAYSSIPGERIGEGIGRIAARLHHEVCSTKFV
jgi:GntR family transcriptional regulator/MocR family aminotransferase